MADINTPSKSVLKSSTEQDSYNKIAIKFSEKLTQFRAGKATNESTVDRPVEDLFPQYNRSAYGLYKEYEGMGNQAVSDELQSCADDMGIEFEHMAPTIGTVLHNVDLKQSQSPELAQFIRNTLLERKVIFFRDQNLSEDQQVEFSRKFGDLDAFPFGKAAENPYLLEIRHGKDSPGAENAWHTDVTWMENPSLGSVAQCITVPPLGGDTLFSDSHACYLGLPDKMQERLQHLSGINDYGIFMMGRGAGALSEDLIKSIKDEIPFGVKHPLLRTHPETGKTGLFLHGGFLRHDSLFDVRTGETLSTSESKEIVNFLLQQHSKPEYTCRFSWTPGSIAFWDNRAVQHYATSDYYPHERLLRRVTISGDRPFYDPAYKV